MNNVRLTGFAELPVVRQIRDVISFFNKRNIIGRMILADTIDQIPVQDIGRDKFGDVLNTTIVKTYARAACSRSSALEGVSTAPRDARAA